MSQSLEDISGINFESIKIDHIYRMWGFPAFGLMLYYDESQDAFWLSTEAGFTITKAEFTKLGEELEKFFDLHPDSEIEAHNHRVWQRRFGQSANIQNEPRSFDHNPWPIYKTKHLNPRDCEPGYIYLMQDLDSNYVYKIGLARDVKRRRKQIGRVEVIHTILTDNMAQTEADLHERFENQWLGGEWFKLNDSEIEYIKSLVNYQDEEFIGKEAANE